MTYYIQYNNEGDDVYPLIWCIANAFPARDRNEYWHHLESIFNYGGGGGDPYWHIERYTDDNGKVMYWANMEQAFSDDQIHCGDYEEALVKKYFARTMREYARVHPECGPKIQELIDKYQLEASSNDERR